MRSCCERRDDGTPKGRVGQHKGFVYAGSQIEAWTKSIFDSGKDIVMLPLPLCHVYANVGGLGLGFVTGSPVALIPNPRDLADVLKTIHTVKPAFNDGRADAVPGDASTTPT
jgi:long-chain acyl-CoA synthetase